METVEAMAERIYGPRQKQERPPKKKKEPRTQSIDNAERVKLFLAEHPHAKVREVAEALTISLTTAKKWVQRVREKDEQKEAQ